MYKIQRAKSPKIITIMSLLFALTSYLQAQNYLSQEKEIEIKSSGRYYWEECAAFDADEARSCAFKNLTNLIIADAVNQSRFQDDEVLKALEMNVHFDNLQQEGRAEILAWIAKDSIFVTTKKTLASKPQPVQPLVEGKTPAPQPTPKSVSSSNSVLQELVACKEYKDVKRVAITNGLVCGEINSTRGFANPEKCIVAVFTADQRLVALLDVGGGSRTDLLSGNTVQYSEQYYSGEQYFLWYMQQK